MQFENQRLSVVELYLQLSKRDYVSSQGGHLMLRLNQDTAAVTPALANTTSLTPQDISLIRLTDLSLIDSHQPLPAQTWLLAQLLQQRPDLNCSLFCRPPLASACALLGKALSVPTEQRPSLGPSLALLDYAPAGSRWLKRRLNQVIAAPNTAWLLRHQGLLCAGADGATAIERCDQVEQVAGFQLHRLIERRLHQETDALNQSLQDLLKQLPRRQPL